MKLLFLLGTLSVAQTLTGSYTITPQDVALITSNSTATTTNTAPFKIYDDTFRTILGSSPSITKVYEASFPAFHEAGVVTSLNPLTIYSSSNQFNTTFSSPNTNNKTIVISRTYLNNVTNKWTSEVVANDTAPLLLTNGGFQYKDGILFVVQGSKAQNYSAGLVYLPTTPTPSNSTKSTLILNNYLGVPLNSPNDVYVSKTGVIYFTDPQIGFAQNIRPPPQLPGQVYGFIPGTTRIRVVADNFQAPNGIQLSPDEKTAYVTDTGPAVIQSNATTFRTIYAYDVVVTTTGNKQYNSKDKDIAQFTNRRVFAMTSVGIPDGIKCDDQGNVWVGAGDGLQIFNPSGDLIGKILIPGGTANFGFASDGRVFALGEKRLWLVRLDSKVNPAVRVGERRG